MSANKYLPHVLVLPEDDANRRIANGFRLYGSLDERRIQILEEAGGWREVLDRFTTVHVPEMEKRPARFMILLIDFDDKGDSRHDDALEKIPLHLRERVFVLGARSEPEQLKSALGSFEAIGLALAKDCYHESEITWGHELLRHNAGELARLREKVRSILFSR